MDESPAPNPDDRRAFGRMWAMAKPIRAYVRRFPIHRGKGVLIRRILLPLLPPDPAVFVAKVPGGGRILLHPRETLGFATLLDGGFESAEIAAAVELTGPGVTAFDVGANVGIYSIALGRTVGFGGKVVAVEPDEDNIARLRANVALNSLENVQVIEAVAGDRDVVVELHIADDPAYNSLGRIERGHRSTETRAVRSVLLDRVWEELDRPDVRFVKIDVEGTEAAVLRGARAMITSTLPALLIEANDEPHLSLLRSELEPLGYRRSVRRGFHPWNHLFLRDGS